MGTESENEKFNNSRKHYSDKLSPRTMKPFTENYGPTSNYSDGGILRGVNELLNSSWELGIGKIDIPQYDDLSAAVSGLYVDDDKIKSLKPLYLEVLQSRAALSASGFFNLTSSETEFASSVTKYLNAVNVYFRRLFYDRINSFAAALPIDTVKEIVEDDIHLVESESDAYYEADTKTARVDICNPLVLSSLYLTRLQYEDFADFCSNLGLRPGDARHALYSELLKNKVERLFRDDIILYEREFYRITDFDCEKCQFIAKLENCLPSIEQISAVRLYEKIVKGVDNVSAGDGVNCLIVGSVKSGSKEMLETMLINGGLKNVTVEYIDTRKDISDILTRRDVFLSKINSYKKVFVLDCPEIYSDISMREMLDDVDVMKRSADDFDTLLSVDSETGARDFYNKNGFAAVYYRVQNYLVRPDIRNSSKARCVNRTFLNWLGKVFECDDKGNIKRPDLRGKEVYVYLSNNRDFRDELYDSYNFVRVERYNSKDCRIIKFSDRPVVPFKSRDTEIRTTFYKIIKMLSNSSWFFRRMTADPMCDCGEDAVNTCAAIKIAQDTKIKIKYAPLGPGPNRNRVKIRMEVLCPDECRKDGERFEKYKAIIGEVLREAFDVHGEFNRTGDNRILFQCFQKAVACVISGCARNYNDLLFHHFYESLYKNMTGAFSFDVEEVDFVDSLDGDGDDETTSYSYKRTAYSLMEDLDSKYYRESYMVYHIRKTTLNKEDIDDYAKNIKEACWNLNYVNSLLHARLVRYYG